MGPSADGYQEIQDHCLDEYHSEDNAESSDSADSLSDEDTKPRNDEGVVCDRRSTPTGLVSASDLLNSGLLDGSGRVAPSKLTDPRPTMPRVPDLPIPTVGRVSPGSGVRKIVYAARTHSQLAQFVSELRRTVWGRDLRVIPLGGRGVLCGNANVQLSSGGQRRAETAISESCLDLQKGAKSKRMIGNGEVSLKRKMKHQSGVSSSGGGCPLLSSRKAVSVLAMHALSRPSDIEDLASMGSASGSCAYYASREALPAAEVVVLPYNILLSPTARASIGLSLQNSLVVIDEAHNIPEALRALSSTRISLPVAQTALRQLEAYTEKYRSRLAGRNLFYLGQLRRFLLAVIDYLSAGPHNQSGNVNTPLDHPKKNNSEFLLPKKSSWSASGEMMSVTELLFKLKLDNLNLFKVLRYLERSRLPQKLLGFANAVMATADISTGSEEENVDHPDFVSKHVSSLAIIQSFLSSLAGNEREGKVVVDWPDESRNTQSSRRGGVKHPAFRYVLLNPDVRFRSVLSDAHVVVLAAGTLRPFSHVAAELFYGDRELMNLATDAEQKALRATTTSLVSRKFTTFSCGHVIPSNHVSLVCLSTGPTSTLMDFRHTTRNDEKICDELGQTLLNITNVTPGGIVVFLPSYSYEARLAERWKKTGFWDSINKRKKLHREPRNARDVEVVLERYSREATLSCGAILLCVVGGKMSEGINFSDDMARCVVVAGLPYPDITDPEMLEKMRSLDKDVKSGLGGISGRDYYRNLCLRAVNQSIGRAIRHKNDYAAIILADTRYSTDLKIWQGLPQWLTKSEGGNMSNQRKAVEFGKALVSLRRFFQEHSQ